MTRHQRRLHRLYWFVLLPLLCLLFLTGLRPEGTRAAVDSAVFETPNR